MGRLFSEKSLFILFIIVGVYVDNVCVVGVCDVVYYVCVAFDVCVVYFISDIKVFTFSTSLKPGSISNLLLRSTPANIG